MAALRHDLEHLDQVEIPLYTAFDKQRRGVSPRVMGVLLVLAVFAGLLLIGLAAELLHRAQQAGH
jgi:hypothetical protein